MEELGNIRYSIILPRKYNPEDGGGLISEDILKKYRKELLEIFSGITQYEATTGFWKDPDAGNGDWEPKGESNYVLNIDAEKGFFPIHRTILEQILDRMCIELRQKAIHFSCQDRKSFLVRSKEEPPRSKKPIKIEPADVMFLLDKKGQIVARGSFNEIKDKKLKDGDCICLVPKKFTDRYDLSSLQAIGRHS